MSSFTCPFCGCATSIGQTNNRSYLMNFSGIRQADIRSTKPDLTPYLMISIFHCANQECGKESIIACGINGYMENKVVNVYPETVCKRYPEYIPENIRCDYEEACSVLNRSPKAAATLARRCLQGMIRDCWGINKHTLSQEINELKDKIPTIQWDTIDALRQMGNIGAHMEKDVNIMLDITDEEARKLIRLIEVLLDDWYIRRHEEDQLYQDICKDNQRLQNERKQVH